MHIMEGFLPLQWCVFWYLLCIPFVWWGLRDIEKLFKEHPEQKLTLAVAGAFIFVLSSLKLPSVTGSSSHPTGTGLSAVLFGFSATAVLSVIVLVFQALLLAHGGITTLGADLFSMGIFGPIVAWAAFQAMRRLNVGLGPSVFVAAVLSDWATYFITSIQLAVAYPAAVGGIVGSFEVFAGVFAITQIPLAIAEGLLLWVFFDYLSKSRPKMVGQLLGKLA
ncbi:MAG: energy-coupling factor ABC transporter permease [Candidatus Micrarchaeota archaeon]|nr:energy-coupling factor ABC transporter permease [Candidatus Micrarchaeota archaeon]